MIDLRENEHIIAKVRKHWFVIATEASFLFILALVPALLFLLSMGNVGELRALFPVLYLGWLLLVWSIFFVLWTDFYLDVLLVTDSRVIDIEQIGLFARDIAELRYENIQDIRVEIGGIIATLLNFGNLHIQTAGVQKEFVIRNIPHPDQVKDIISAQQHAALPQRPA